jgi:CCR4-NOT transcription complex subunit 6
MAIPEIRFVPFEGDDEAPSPKTLRSFRIVSWNTLADQYIGYQHVARPDANRRIFDQVHRHRLLGQVFQHFVDMDVDFICLQEVDFKVARQVLVDRNSYTRLLTPTGHGYGDGRVDACCIFYKSADWTIMGREEIINLDDLAGSRNPPSSEFGESFRRRNFGIMASFRHRLIPDKVVTICNTHLYWNPVYEYVKLCQAHYLCLKAEALIVQNETIQRTHFIFCGDLNSQPGGLVHEYLSMGEVDTEDSYSQLIAKSPSANLCPNHEAKSWLAQGHLECPLRHFLFQSAYAKQDASGSVIGEDIKFTNATTDFQGVIDYIFFPSCLLTQTKRLSMPSVKKEQSKESIIPTRGWPSDHVAIGAEFSFDD